MNGPSKALSFTHKLKASQCKSLLQHFTSSKSLTKLKLLHAHLTTSSLLSPNLLSGLAVSYVLCGHIPHARQLFDKLHNRTVFLYNAMIRLYIQKGLFFDGIQVFIDMVREGTCRPDNYTFPFVIKACGELGLRKFGGSVHGRTVADGFELDGYVQNSLLAMYMSFGECGMGRRVFDGMREKTIVSWNILISGLFRNGCAEEALRVFERMGREGVEGDCATVVSVLPACGYLKRLELGRKVHALVEEKGFGENLAMRNALVDMYAKCGRMDEARTVVDEMDKRDVVTWTSMINGFILNGDTRTALGLCCPMQLDGVRPNSVTLASLLSACADLHLKKEGRCLHGWAIRQRLESDVIVETGLIDMYAKCNHMELSLRVFRRTSKKRTAPWNAVISGCIHNGLETEAVKIFKLMLLEEVDPDPATLNSLLPAYAVLADLQQAMNIHGYLWGCGFLSASEIATGLIDIYFKSGSIQSAHKIFNEIPRAYKDIIAWSVIVAGYGKHGHGKAAISLFHEMVHSGIKPNEVTFTSALHACSHAGLLDEGLSLFKFMVEDHKLHPLADHYTCIVDLLGRSGRLGEAYNLISTMPFKPTHAVWGALLGACVIHENVEIGEVAANQLFEIEPDNTGNYVLLAKIYAAKGMWKDAESVRHMMNEIGLRKTPAQSLIEVRSAQSR